MVYKFTLLSPVWWVPLLLLSGPVSRGHGQLPGRLEATAYSPEMLEDAELQDVRFVDPDRGWAVGDRGVIWQTVDGGRHWKIQPSRVASHLRSIHFVDGQHGWIAGGHRHAYSHQSSGMLLATSDGGRRWTRIPTLALPALEEIHFVNQRQGWAVGSSSAMYPSGIFRTRDGGRSWSTLPAGRIKGWQTADFHDHEQGVVAGLRGQVGRVNVTQVKTLENPPWGKRTLRSLRMANATDGWLVGDGGLVLVSRDGGLHWQKPPGALPRSVEDQFDFQAVAIAGKHCWIAGSPGSRVIHTADGGQNWEVFPTPQSLPIKALTFLDTQRGWAVGALGTIMATRDGGRTWRVQRRGGERAAVAGFFSHAQQVPWESLAALSGNQGYLGVVHVLDQAAGVMGRRDVIDQQQRLREAVVSVGGSGSGLIGSWTFPDATLQWDAEQIVKRWDRSSERSSLQVLQEQLVRRIRQWKPEVILTEAASTTGKRPAAHLTHQLVLRAAELAADRTIFPEQISVAGLEPWSVKKVLSTLKPGLRGTVNVSSDQLATRLGMSLADSAFVARGLVAERYEQAPAVQGFRFSINRLPQELGQQALMGGIRLAPGGAARRLLATPPITNLERLNRSIQKRRQVDQLLVHQASQSEGRSSWLAQLQDLTRGMETRQVAEVLYQLGYRYHESGQPELAAEVFQRLVRDCPEHDLVPAVYAYLVACYASGEVSWQQRSSHQPLKNQGQSRTAAEQKALLAKQPAVGGRPADTVDAGADVVLQHLPGVSSTFSRPASQQQAVDAWTGQAILLGKQVQRLHPQLYSEPMVRFPLATVARKRGLTRDTDQLYQLLVRQAADQNWWNCAQVENWLTHRRNVPPKETVICRRTVEKPFLDGRLDEPFWKSASPAKLVTAVTDDNPWPAEIRFAGDASFLYLAIRCRKAAEITYRSTTRPRSRDADLSAHDRVDVWIDIDRDYQTYYRLTVDCRGWTGDACWGNTSWNPSWFVAAAEDEQEWIVEAAIAWEQLAERPPTAEDAWAVAVQRIIPSVGFQSWTQPASVADPGERCGLLLFR